MNRDIPGTMLMVRLPFTWKDWKTQTFFLPSWISLLMDDTMTSTSSNISLESIMFGPPTSQKSVCVTEMIQVNFLSGCGWEQEKNFSLDIGRSTSM